MTYSIVTASVTGNTRAVAEAIAAALPKAGCVFCGAPEDADAALAADVIFAGFWTDKGGCPPDMAAFLARCGGKRVALFGTAGFGGDPNYFAAILGRVRAALPAGAVFLDGWMCPGRMPASVRDRFAALLEKTPGDPHAVLMVQNYEAALPHPTPDDLAGAARWAKDVLAKAERGAPDAG